MRNRFICETHFEETDFKTPKKFYLKNTAVPKKYNLDRNYVSDSDTDEDLQVLSPVQTYSNKMKVDIFPSSFDSPPEKRPRRDSQCSSPTTQFVAATLDLPNKIISPRKRKLLRKIHFITKKIQLFEEN